VHQTIQGIPVAADPLLSQEQINHFVSELKKTWSWGGRQLGRIEFHYIDHMIHISIYEKPVSQIIPLHNNETKGVT